MNIPESLLRMGQIVARAAWESGVTPMISAFLRDDVAVANNQLALAATQRARRRMTGGVQTSVLTTYANVPDLAVTINRVGGIAFEYWLAYLTSAAGEGIGVQLAFSGVANGITYSVEAYTDPATRANLLTPTDFGTGLVPFSAGPGATVPAIIQIRGSCNVTTVGDLNVQLRAETGGANSATLLSSSWGSVWSS